MNENTYIPITSMFKIETSNKNTYLQSVDMDFIYSELFAIDVQVVKLKQVESSPFEFFTPNPYEEEQVDFTLLHKLTRQNSVVKTLAVYHKALNDIYKSSDGIDKPMREALNDCNVALMYNLMLLFKLIGEFNQFIEDYQYIARTKLADAKASFNEYHKFENDFDIALRFTSDVVSHFYQSKNNRPYKLKTLIKAIDNFCVNQRVPYPKSLESKAFIHFYNKISMFAPIEARKRGRSMKGYSEINEDVFAKEYGYLLLKN
ncbi:hypothetical protein [Shewanella sp. SACH]|uniref:hypothetical protein n=1 Tax=Shewanella sp. SACH TaxID=1873135 RepID=UPI00111EC07F|nr:hypothetical protein [Shewanella sp. SACH]